MKYLSDYTEDAITKALDKHGAFFAFSNEQFNKSKKEGVQYVSCGSGLIAPKENAIQLMNDIETAGEMGIAQDISENGKEAIIKRELGNHEAYYTGDIDSTVDALERYGITREEIWSVFRNRNKKLA